MIFRCTYCGEEFATEAELSRHSRGSHGTDVQQIDGSALDVDIESESITGAAITDFIAGVQEAGFGGTERAAVMSEEAAAPSGRLPPPARRRESTLGDLLDPRDEYRCAVCGDVFRHREDLDRHRWIEHGPRRAAG